MECNRQDERELIKVKKSFIYGRFIIIFLLLYYFKFSAYSQNNDFEFEYIGNEAGLVNLRVTSILQDQPGYIWIGTIRGLFRYNGYAMKVYKSNPMDSTSLKYHQINCLIEDGDNELWIGTRFGGLNRYDREKDNFKRINIPAKDIYCIANDKEDFLWVGTENGLFRYIKEEDRYETYHFRSANGSSERLIQTIHCNDSETLVNIAELGILKYESRENDFSPLILLEECESFNVTSITQIYKYNDHVYWLGTDQGLLILDTWERNKLKRLRDIHGTEINSKIEFILEESFQYIWVGANGIYRYDLLENELIHMTHQPDKSFSLVSNLVSCAYKDRQDNIWIGTAGSGINIWSHSHSRFNCYSRINTTLVHISRDITTLTLDEEKNLWIGTRDKGVVIFDKDQNHLKYMSGKFPELEDLSRDFVRVIEQGPDKKIWIGSTTRKLTMIDPVNNDSYSITIEEGKEVLGEKDMVTCVLPESDAFLWVGTGYNGLLLFDIKFRKFIDYDARNQLASYNILDLERDSRGNVWIATHKNGVLKMSPDGEIKRQNFQDLPITINSNANFITIYEDSEDNLWFGTEFHGLIKLSPDQNSYIFDISEKLTNNEISSITEDSYGRLWISTTGGLVRFDKLTQTKKYYNWRDGMASDEFNYNASEYSNDGIIYLGGTNGLVYFTPDQIKDNLFIPPVFIETLLLRDQEVKIGNGNSILRKALPLTDNITLKYSQNDIGFEIAALNFITSAKNQYAYKLDGSGNSDWINIGDRRFIELTNLRFGKYILHVTASNNDNIWNEQGASLGIRILPPVWLSWWAIIIYVFLVSITIYYSYREVKQRIHLKNQITLQVIEQKHQEELTNMKIQFFTNISHEFKIPLSLIISPIEDMLLSFKGSNDFRKKLQLIRTNASRLLRLVTLLIDFRKAEQEVLQLEKRRADLVSLCSSTIDSFRSMIVSENKHIEFRSESPACIFEFDIGKIERVLYNLIDNAVSFTDSLDEIIVQLFAYEEQEEIKLEVRDTGHGIPEKDIENIFEKFYQAGNLAGKSSGRNGSGIGLYLCRKIVDLHGGTIQVESTLDQGTAIIIKLPAPGLNTIADETEIGEDYPNPLEIVKIEPFDEQGPAILSDNTPRVLIVEDHIELGSHIQKLLWSYYRTDTAVNGKEGLELVRKHIPDLIISDIMMPEMDGIEMCKWIKSDPKLEHIPVILLSARSDMDSKIKGFDIGADDYLEKPFLPQHLLSRVHNLIKSREKLRAHFSEETQQITKKAGISHFDREFLEKAFYKIEQNIKNPDYNVNELSTALNISRVHLYRRFKDLTGMTPKDYMKEARLKLAAKLLEEDRYSISEIGYQVGFNTPSNFTVAFKAFYGISPKEYKKGS